MGLKGRLNKFFQRSRDEQGLFISAGCLLIAIRTGLAIFSFERVRMILSFLAKDMNTEKYSGWEGSTVERIVWAVSTASRHLPVKMNCFPRALATQVLLSRQNIASELKIGVSRMGADQFEAHAWVVCNGRVIMGELDDLDRFKPLDQLDKKLL